MGKTRNILALVIVAIIGSIIFWKRDLIKEKFGIATKSKAGESSAQNAIAPAPTPVPSSTVPDSSTFPIKRGSNARNVKVVQMTLNKKYSANITVDGVFGPATEKALESAGFGKELEMSEYIDFMF